MLGSPAVVGRRRGSVGLACFERRSCGSPAVRFGGSTVMQVWARISGNGKLSTQSLGNFWLVVFRLGHQWLLEFFIFFFFANGGCKMRILYTKSKEK
jgi:hypothetical protein